MNNMPEVYKGLISFLGEALPDEYDAILFDLTEKGYPVIEQADWGSEDINDVRKCLVDLIRSGRINGNDCILNVIVPSRKKMLKGSFYFVREGDKPLYAVALLMELDMLLKMSGFLTNRLNISGPDGINEINLGDFEPVEHRITDLDEISRIVREFCNDPSKLTPSERKELFMDIYDTGIFKIKGAIPKAAEAMGISEKSVYRYISEIRKMRK
ncbi:MAG: helix-turn-helix domain-containing protein [Firmicutes bacterium]|nr:helix-turn-helix domain-containing protein [Bacillota bacterium]